MLKRRYCTKCNEWKQIKSKLCPECSGNTSLTRAIRDPEEVRRYVCIRPEFKEQEEEIINMIAQNSVILEGHFLILDDQG